MIELWTLWAILGGFVVFYGVRGLKDIREIFSPPLIISLLLFGILVKSYFDIDEVAIAALLDMDYYVLTLMYAALGMTLYAVGYEFGLRHSTRLRSSDWYADRLPVSYITAYVAMFGAIGFAAQYAVASYSGGLVALYSQAHGAAGDFDNISAYLHALPTFMWSALLIGFVVIQRSPKRLPVLIIVTFVVGAMLFAHTYLFGNRNGIIRFALLLGGAYAFIHRPSFMKSMPLILLLGAAVVSVLVVSQIRAHLHLGSDVSLFEALQEYFDNTQQRGGKVGVRLEAGGHEFFFNVAVVQAAWISSTYDYGAQFIYPIINFIPRAWWPDKPYQIDFGVNYFVLVRDIVGWDAGGGSAIGAVGYTFLAFSWFGALIWGILGYVSGRSVRAARDAPTMMNLAYFLSILLSSVYWGSQSWSAFFFAFLFTILPVYVLHVVAPFIAPAPVSRRGAVQPGPPRPGTPANRSAKPF